MILLRRLRVHALKHLRDIDIWFPRHGSVLVEGHNESGKSTLFEAIYFALYGAPLVGEEASPSLAALIPHGEDTALVGLTLLAGDTELEIRRELKVSAGKRQRHEAKLVVRHADGRREELHTVAAVNARILQELHGLDGNALRNSCLMEQQALDRIEALSRDAREDAIARLLGLDVLRRAARDLQPTRAQEASLDVLRAYLEVAQSQRAAQNATSREMDATGRWRAAEVRREVEARDRLLAAQSAADTTSKGEAEREERLRERVASARRAEALLARVDEVGRKLATAREASEKAGVLTSRLSELAEHVGDRLPQTEARLAALTRLQPALVAATQRLAEVDEALRLAREEAAARNSLDAAQEAVAEAAAKAEMAQTTAARAETRETLEKWLRVAEGSGPSEAQARAEQMWAEYNAMQRRHTAAREQARTWLVLTLLAGAAALVAAVLGASAHPLWLAAVVAAIAAVLFGVLWHGAQARFAALAPELERLQRALHAAVPEREGSRELAALEAAVARSGLSMPHDVAAGRHLLAQLGADLPPAVEARGAADGARARLEQARSQLRLAELDLDRAHQARVRAGIADDATLDDLAQERRAAQEALAGVSAELASLGIASTVEAASAARGAAEADLRSLRDRAAECQRLTDDERQTSERAAGLRARCASTLATLIEEAASEHIPTPEPLATNASMAALMQAHAALDQAVRERLADLDTAGARAELAAQAVRREGQRERIKDVEGEVERRVARIRDLLAEQEIAGTGQESLSELCARWPRLAETNPSDAESLRAEVERAHVDAEHARRTSAALAERYHVAESALDEAACRQALEDAERDLRQHRIAAELADEAFARIVRRVLPETEVHMRAVLPELTAGRYRDVQLLHEDAAHSADLRIKVWDQLAGRYVAKNLFSGGTRDQCSLALRLAFALATLPKELGAIPGFIFLDEPLSSFDAERSQALVHILTQGTIARHFSQVVLISHSQSFEHSNFSYRLHMAGGRVTESTLPREAEAQHLWGAETATPQAS